MRYLILSFVFYSTFAYSQTAQLVTDFAPGTDSGISSEASILATLGDVIIINNESHILYSDGSESGTKNIYDLNNSDILRGQVTMDNVLYISEYTNSDTSRILRITEDGTAEVMMEQEGTTQLYLSYKDKLYYNRRFSFQEYFYSYDPATEEVEEIIQLNWFRRDGLKDAVVFNDLIYFIGWPDDRDDSNLMTYDGEGNIDYVTSFFISAVDLASRISVNMTVADNQLYFWYSDGTSESILYVTDGTENGTQALNSDFKLYYRNESFRTIGTVGNVLLFEGLDMNNDRHLWRSDGTTAGTYIIEQEAGIDITPRYFTKFQDKAVFCGYHGSQPFSAPDIATIESDGTLAGTTTLLVPDDIPGQAIENGYWLVNHKEYLFTVGRKISFPFDQDLYKSDGTPAGTIKVSTIGDQDGNAISHLASAKNNLYFFGTTDSLGTELYVYRTLADEDGDGFTADVDCDDTNASVNPGATEEPYNGVDDDCDPATLDDDLDQDGFVLAEDCDDTDPDINPDAIEIPDNGIDEDCDGMDETTSTHNLNDVTVRIYPNPARDIILIESDKTFPFQSRLYDLKGRIIQSAENKNRLDIRTLNEGMYILEITDKASAKKIVELVVIER